MNDLGFAIDELEKAERSLAKARKVLELASLQDPSKILTEREYEIAELSVAGLSEDQVANALDISRNTVNSHKKRIFHKLKLRGVRELIPFWKHCLQNKEPGADLQLVIARRQRPLRK